MFFSEGSAELGTRARTALEAQAAWLKRNAAVPVTIEGHADDAGAISAQPGGVPAPSGAFAGD